MAHVHVNQTSNFSEKHSRHVKAAGRTLFGRGYVFRPSQSETVTIPNLLRAKIKGLHHCPTTFRDEVGGDLFKLVKEINCFTQETYGLTTINREA